MSDWPFLNKHRVRTPVPSGINPVYASDDSFGFNGMFRFMLDGAMIRCVASDGTDAPSDGPEWKWQHVSVSIEGDKRPPRWSVMCHVKDLFWEPEDWCCQFHPAHSDYVNYHSGCLHIWKPLVEKLPTPLAIMVGPKMKAIDIRYRNEVDLVRYLKQQLLP